MSESPSKTVSYYRDIMVPTDIQLTIDLNYFVHSGQIDANSTRGAIDNSLRGTIKY